MQDLHYSVVSSTESYDTNSLEEARSVLQSMAEHFGSAKIIDNETKQIIYEL